MTAQPTTPVSSGGSARDALLAAAIELFADHGSASVSIRDIARHAGVNHGLVHRHFGSKDELLSEAIEVGSFSLLPGAFATGGFDVDDDIAVGPVRPRYPVLRGLLSFARGIPADARPPAVADLGTWLVGAPTA